jgi:hypothetical protein
MFVPKKIVDRQERLKCIYQEKFLRYEAFVKEFEIDLEKIPNLMLDDLKEQFFLDLFKNIILIRGGQLNISGKNYPFNIFLFKHNQYMFRYDWQHGHFWYHYDRVWQFFEADSGLEYIDISDKISDMLVKYFKFRPMSVKTIVPASGRILGI